MSAEIIHGDCIEVMRAMPENSVDSIVTDPPYGLGFMGKAWDSLPPGLEWAVEARRVLKPGGHLIAFGGTRTWHRLAVSIEDAGLEIRDSIAWMYGSGFPKHRAALKPAFEPAVMARKPFKGALSANEAIHGTGALNIDGCRVNIDADERKIMDARSGSNTKADGWGFQPTGETFKSHAAGRWPANVVLDDDAAAELDAQSGIIKDRNSGRGGWPKGGYVGGEANSNTQGVAYKGEGGASRFFYVAKAPKRERPVVDGVAHATVKPLTLMRHLVKLVTPAGGVVLDPFAGSGTTAEACILEGFRCIAIEREAEYLPLIQARIDRTAA